MQNKNEQRFFQKNMKFILIGILFFTALICYFYYTHTTPTVSIVTNSPLVQTGGKVSSINLTSNKFVINNIPKLNNLLDSF